MPRALRSLLYKPYAHVHVRMRKRLLVLERFLIRTRKRLLAFACLLVRAFSGVCAPYLYAFAKMPAISSSVVGAGSQANSEPIVARAFFASGRKSSEVKP